MSRVLPILFNTEMVRAILDGRKTVTRRVIKFPVNRYTKKIPDADSISVYPETLHSEKVGFHEEPFYCLDIKPPYHLGDILYVQETWFYEHHMEDRTAGKPDLPSGRYSRRYIYKADNPDYPVNIGVGATGWRPSIHMPKEAARIWLKVTDVRVERLQDISGEEILKEGIEKSLLFEGNVKNAFDKFSNLWNSTIKKSDLDRYGWDANPYVFVIEFERCEKPEGEQR